VKSQAARKGEGRSPAEREDQVLARSAANRRRRESEIRAHSAGRKHRIEPRGKSSGNNVGKKITPNIAVEGRAPEKPARII